jgi:hypothetical protein
MRVVGALMQYEQQKQPYREGKQFDKYAIVWKLKKVRKIDQNPQIMTVLTLIDSNEDVLKIMSQN